MPITNEQVFRIVKSIEVLEKRVVELLESSLHRIGGGSGGGGAHVVIDLDGLATEVTVQAILDMFDVDLSTRASELTLDDCLDELIDANIELDNIESSLNTLITQNNANFGLTIAEIITQTGLSIAAIVANAVTIVAGQVAAGVINSAALQDVEDEVANVTSNTAQIIKQTKNQFTGLYVASATITAAAFANFRFQFDFGAADSRAKLRTVTMIRTQGSGSPGLLMDIYNQDQAVNTVNLVNEAPSVTHRVSVDENITQPAGGQNVFRLDAGLILSFDPDIYQFIITFEVTRDTFPTLTQWGTVHTVTNLVEEIIGLDE